MPTAKPKTKSNSKKPSPKGGDQPNRTQKTLLITLIALLVIAIIILKMSLFKTYPVEGKKQMLSINTG